jgi:adenosine deaminase
MPQLDPILADAIRRMPKVELHVHLEGAIQPETLLRLARRNAVELPAQDIDGLRRWYTFTDFAHFVDIYRITSSCLRSPEDIELIAREFLAGQAAQNIRYSEVTYTAHSHFRRGLAFADQMEALARARQWAQETLGVSMGLVIDISRDQPAETGVTVAEWVIRGRETARWGIVALGLGGPELDNPPEKFQSAFDLAWRAGVPCVPHAGETQGPASIWGALNRLHAVRIGHGVRCLEDPALLAELRARQIPLEVCPTSNICLKVADDFQRHPLPRLLAEGLYVTLNSDDPAMFNTSLTEEFLHSAAAFSLGADQIQALTRQAALASLLPPEPKAALLAEMNAFWQAQAFD